MRIVFILQSIKPRVETFMMVIIQMMFIPSLYPTIHQTKGWNLMFIFRLLVNLMSLSYNPSNQGLKLDFMDSMSLDQLCLYPTIHQTKGWNRITTCPISSRIMSLSYNPSNQGLKQPPLRSDWLRAGVFILQSIKPRVETIFYPSDTKLRLGLYPTIHQTKGWNTSPSVMMWSLSRVFILQSIKPRVETHFSLPKSPYFRLSLSYNPSNQGLKPFPDSRFCNHIVVFILQSIKPRVETRKEISPCKERV